MTVISPPRVFDFSTDTFAYPNELVWEYRLDEKTGKTRTEKRDPPPAYAHHCFVVVRSARQFFQAADFAPHEPALSDAEYLERIKAVARISARTPPAADQRIKFPGFSNLREFSQARPNLLKTGCGGSWQSYAQRGNWRMTLPFTRSGQQKMAATLREGIAAGRLPILHVATFPSLTINHALLLFGCSGSPAALEFQAYDPNLCERPLTLLYDGSSRSFQYPSTRYFAGGPVNAYEVYHGTWF